jgi:hypothetical protein
MKLSYTAAGFNAHIACLLSGLCSLSLLLLAVAASCMEQLAVPHIAVCASQYCCTRQTSSEAEQLTQGSSGQIAVPHVTGCIVALLSRLQQHRLPLATAKLQRASFGHAPRLCWLLLQI